jgi:hypothetical protein
MTNYKQKRSTIIVTGLLALCYFIVVPAKAQTNTSNLITVNLKQASFKSFISEIQSQSGIHFYYNPEEFKDLSISIAIKQQSVKYVLDQFLLNTNFYYSIGTHNNIFLTKGKALSLNLPDSSTIQKNKSLYVNSALQDEPIVNNTFNENSIDKKIYEIGERNTSSSASATLVGNIKDIKTGEPIVGASVYIEKPKIGTVTDQYGYFTISLPKGKQLLNIQSIGMRDIKRQLVVNGDGKMNVDMTIAVMSLKKVVISTQKISNIRGTQMGVQKIDIKSIKQVPVVFGESDILRVVTTLPGVKTVGEASTGLNVRGGAADQNLILFNDGTIYNPTHFFGMFSAFNPEVIKNVELYKGAIPAEFGGRLASVLDINSREGNKKNFTGSAGIGLLTSRVNLEGPIEKNKSSFILGGRSTYSNWLFNVLPDQYQHSSASFYDLNLSVNNEINKKNTLYINGYLSADRFNLNSDTVYGYANKNFSIKLKHFYTNKFYGIFTTGLDRYEYNISSSKIPINSYQLKFNINQKFAKAQFNYVLNNKHSFDFGVNTILYNLEPGTYSPLSAASLIVKKVVDAEKGLESALFLSDHFTITSALKLDAGIRLSMFNYLGPQQISNYAKVQPKTEFNSTGITNYGDGALIKTYGGPEYRLGLRYVVDETLSLKAGFNTQRQYIHSLSNTTAMAPTDIWKLSDPNIKPQLGSQISIGAYKNLKSNTIETSIEVYYKNISNYLDYKSGAVLVMNQHIETDVIGTKGKAYGIEFLLKKTTGKLNGWISYTWSRILLQMNDPSLGSLINKGASYPANYDKPHDVTIIGNYKFSHRFSISLNGTYSTGRPITLPIGVFNYAGSSRTLYADRNAYRIPDYFRTDFSMNIEGNHKVNQLTHNSWTIGIYNLTGRKNPYSVYYVAEEGNINGYKLSIFGNAIPYINFNIRFK